MNARLLQRIPIVNDAFDIGHLDGMADAMRGDPRDPALRFQSWHRGRDVRDYAEYELGYRRSYAQVQRGG